MSTTPLHTRLITVRLSRAEDECVLVKGRLVDVRKRGIVPMPGKLRGPGVIHDMGATVWLERRGLIIRRIEPAMYTYPFLAAPQTRGEWCGGRLGDIQQLVGLELPATERYGEKLTELIGGPRGCFHMFTLLRLLGPSAVWAIRCEHKQADSAGDFRPEPGSPISARSIIVDGIMREDRQLELHSVLSDIHYPFGPAGPSLDEAPETSIETAVSLRTGLPELKAADVAGRTRRSGPGLKQVSPWEPVEAVARLDGLRLHKGFSAGVQRLFGDADGTQPLTLLVLAMAPVVMQCLPGLVDLLDLAKQLGKGPHPAIDSCHIWRTGGPLEARERARMSAPPTPPRTR